MNNAQLETRTQDAAWPVAHRRESVLRMTVRLISILLILIGVASVMASDKVDQKNAVIRNEHKPPLVGVTPTQ